MRKRIISPAQKETKPPDQNWLNVEALAEVEITSEDAAYPIEGALTTEGASGWRSAEPGNQTIRLLFDDPQSIRLIRLVFNETDVERTQEYVLRWSSDGGQSFQEIVRQQWNFNPNNATSETEDHQVDLAHVTVLELNIIPDISGEQAIASLDQMLLA